MAASTGKTCQQQSDRAAVQSYQRGRRRLGGPQLSRELHPLIEASRRFPAALFRRIRRPNPITKWVLNGRRLRARSAMQASCVGLLSVIAAAIAMSPAQAAAAATSGGVTITLWCEIGTVGTGTFKVTANGSSALVTVPC